MVRSLSRRLLVVGDYPRVESLPPVPPCAVIGCAAQVLSLALMALLATVVRVGVK